MLVLGKVMLVSGKAADLGGFVSVMNGNSGEKGVHSVRCGKEIGRRSDLSRCWGTEWRLDWVRLGLDKYERCEIYYMLIVRVHFLMRRV